MLEDKIYSKTSKRQKQLQIQFIVAGSVNC